MTRGRIERVTVTPLAFRDPPLLNAEGVHEPHVLRALIELVVNDGRGGRIVGFGECTGHAWQVDWLNLVAPTLMGCSVFDTALLSDRVERVLLEPFVDENAGHAPLPAPEFDRRRVHAALEVAHLDAIGRLLGLPVAELLGGRRRHEVDYAGYLFYKLEGHPDHDGIVQADEWGEALTPEGVVAQASRMIEGYGFRSLKLKGGVFSPEVEIETLEALAHRFPGMPLRLDPNTAWSVPTALRVLPRLAGLVEYLEDPVAGQAAMAELARAGSPPLATNMCVVALRDVWPAAQAGAVEIVLADHHYWEGLRGTMTLDALCHAAGLRLSMHSNSHLGVSLAAMTHAAAAARMAFACDTHFPWNAPDDIVHRDGPPFVRGKVAVGDKPGLGIEIDRAVVDRLHAEYVGLGREHRQDQRYAVELGIETVIGPLPRW